jgi:hypothetical protein
MIVLGNCGLESADPSYPRSRTIGCKHEVERTMSPTSGIHQNHIVCAVLAANNFTSGTDVNGLRLHEVE